MRLFLLTIATLVLAAVVQAQDPEDGPIRGDPRNAKPDPRALGTLGGEGIHLTGDEALSAGLRPPSVGIRVVSLISGSPGAAGGLMEGDVIVGVGKKSLAGKLPPFHRLAELLEAPRKAEAEVEVKVLRDRKLSKIRVLLPATDKAGRDWPADSDRARLLLDGALAWLADHQAEDGSLPTRLGGANGQTAVTTIAGLAFLASGSTPTEGPYAENIVRARDWLEKHAGFENEAMTAASGKNWSQVNWALGYAPLFLARVQALDPREESLARLTEMRDALLANMEPTGGWAHGPRNELPYPLDYAELTATGNICLAALGEIQSLGLQVKKEAVAKALEYIEQSSDGGGGVGYSTRPGQRGMGAAGRTASALLAMSRLELSRRPLYKKLAGYLRRNLADLPHGHVSPDFHYFFGALACRALGKRDWNAFAQTFRLEILSLWNGDGTFGVRPADTSRFGMSNTDRTMGPAWRTATFAMILALPAGHLDAPAGSLAGEK